MLNKVGINLCRIMRTATFSASVKPVFISLIENLDVKKRLAYRGLFQVWEQCEQHRYANFIGGFDQQVKLDSMRRIGELSDRMYNCLDLMLKYENEPILNNKRINDCFIIFQKSAVSISNITFQKIVINISQIT